MPDRQIKSSYFEEIMPKRTTHRRESRNPLAVFLRRPLVQIGLVVVAVIAIIVIAILGQQPVVTEHPPAVSNSLGVSTALPNEINVDEAYKLYQSKGAFFLDVREQSEWDSFHIPGTMLVPLGQLPQRLSEIPKDQSIVVVCRSGNRSASGRDILKQAGYTNVTSMAGGVTTWKTQGYPIEP
jgi:rhodanese-related sulfurtransferase